MKALFDIMTLLVYYLNTLDGKRNSAQDFLTKISSDLIIDHDFRKQVVLGVIKKYKVMKLRFKISYLAFEAKQTIHQLLLTTILKSYYTLILNGEIPISMVDLYKIQHSKYTKIRDLP